jgi:hypothetical protein
LTNGPKPAIVIYGGYTMTQITDNASINYAIEDIEAAIFERYGIHTDEKFRAVLEDVLGKVYHDAQMYMALVEVK